jgi:hypothetical protein
VRTTRGRFRPQPLAEAGAGFEYQGLYDWRGNPRFGAHAGPLATRMAITFTGTCRWNLKEEPLQNIAKKTGGKYYRADNAKHFREIIRGDLIKLEKTEAE